MHAVLFETINLVMHLDSEQELVTQCVTLLGKFIGVREPNIRYLGLENMGRLALMPEMLHVVQAHQVTTRPLLLERGPPRAHARDAPRLNLCSPPLIAGEDLQLAERPRHPHPRAPPLISLRTPLNLCLPPLMDLGRRRPSAR
eukprot:1179413-Prorocentrum_minimum.AAC.2